MANGLVLDYFLTWADTNNFVFAPMVRTRDEAGPVDASKMAGVAEWIFLNGLARNDSVFDSVVAATLRSDAVALTAPPRDSRLWRVQSQEILNSINQASADINSTVFSPCFGCRTWKNERLTVAPVRCGRDRMSVKDQAPSIQLPIDAVTGHL